MTLGHETAAEAEAQADLAALRRTGIRWLRLVFGAVALVAITIGLLIHTFAPWLGLDAESHRAIATAFAAMGSIYGIAVWWWDRAA